MKSYIGGFQSIFRDKISITHFIIATLAFFVIFLVFQNFSTTFLLLTFERLSLHSRIVLALQALTDVTNLKETDTLLILLGGSFLGGCNVVLATQYFSKRGGGINLFESFSSSFGAFIVTLSIGCSACGGILLFFTSGLSATFASLIYQSNLLSYIGLGLLLLSAFMFSRRMGEKSICSPS